MANIIINNECNLACEYCFAHEVRSEDAFKISLNQFDRIVNFILRTPNERIGIIGGEPLLHPQFGEMLKRLIFNPSAKNVIVFTNGILMDKFMKEFTSSKIKILVNVNTEIPKVVEKLESNLDMAYFDYYLGSRITLGINIYKIDQDFSEFFRLAKKYNVKQIRTALVVPVDKKEGSKAYFKRFIPTVKKFLRLAIENNVSVAFDCNLIPVCLVDIELRKLLEATEKDSVGRKYITTDSCTRCNPTIDILPDGQAIRCFGLSELKKYDIYEHENITELKYRMLHDLDSKLVDQCDDECKDCRLYKCLKCFGGCLAFKL